MSANQFREKCVAGSDGCRQETGKFNHYSMRKKGASRSSAQSRYPWAFHVCWAFSCSAFCVSRVGTGSVFARRWRDSALSRNLTSSLSRAMSSYVRYSVFDQPVPENVSWFRRHIISRHKRNTFINTAVLPVLREVMQKGTMGDNGYLFLRSCV